MQLCKLPSAWRAVRDEAARARAVTKRVRRLARKKPAPPPPDSAKPAGLRYVNDATMPGIRRIGQHNRVRYVDPHGRTIADPAERQRIKSLAIPPAWTDVWICPDPRGHLQATGRAARRWRGAGGRGGGAHSLSPPRGGGGGPGGGHAPAPPPPPAGGGGGGRE